MLEPNSTEARKEAQKLWEKACALAEGELVLHENQHRKPPGFWAGLKLKRAIKLFEQVLQLVPNHWNSMWMLGKTVQRIGKERTAFDWFVKAWDETPQNVDVAREAALSAMRLGLARHAIEYCEAALKLKPDEPGLMCNLALALIHNGQSAEALAKAKIAVDRNPKDIVNVNVLRLAAHLLKTGDPCPRDSAELDAYCRKHREIFH